MGSAVKVNTSFCFLCAFIILTVPLQWVLSAFMGALIHELCHIMAIRLCGKHIFSVNIGILGAEIQTETLSGWQEIFCLAAGPVGSLSLLFLFRWLPLTALIGGIQGIFNLLPVLPLDGGRILSSIFRSVFGNETGMRIMQIAEGLFFFLLMSLTLCGVFLLKFGGWIAVPIILLAGNMISRKIPCKLSQLGVQ